VACNSAAFAIKVDAVGESDGNKLEHQVLMVEDGYETVLTYPFGECLRLTANARAVCGSSGARVMDTVVHQDRANAIVTKWRVRCGLAALII